MSSENKNLIIKSMLTTFDNPWNPFENWNEWYQFDCDNHYDSCGMLARQIGNVLDDAMPSEEVKVIESAIDEIVKNDMLNRYTKVQKVLPVDVPVQDDIVE